MKWQDDPSQSHEGLNTICWSCNRKIGFEEKFCSYCGAGPADTDASGQGSEDAIPISRVRELSLGTHGKNDCSMVLDDADHAQAAPTRSSKQGDRENVFSKIARWTIGLGLFATAAVSVLDPLIKTGNSLLVFLFFLAIFFFGLLIYSIRRYRWRKNSTTNSEHDISRA